MFDWFTQTLTSSSMWLQVPIVLGVAVPLCAVVAEYMQRALNFLGAKTYRWFNGEGKRRIRKGE